MGPEALPQSWIMLLMHHEQGYPLLTQCGEEPQQPLPPAPPPPGMPSASGIPVHGALPNFSARAATAHQTIAPSRPGMPSEILAGLATGAVVPKPGEPRVAVTAGRHFNVEGIPTSLQQPSMNAHFKKELVNEFKGNALSANMGDRKSVTKQHDRHLFYVLGCATYDVRLCPNQLGTDLINGLRRFSM